jgi:hypothetical protein
LCKVQGKHQVKEEAVLQVALNKNREIRKQAHRIPDSSGLMLETIARHLPQLSWSDGEIRSWLV